MSEIPGPGAEISGASDAEKQGRITVNGQEPDSRPRWQRMITTNPKGTRNWDMFQKGFKGEDKPEGIKFRKSASYELGKFIHGVLEGRKNSDAQQDEE